MLLKGCQATGYCLLVAGKLYAPTVSLLSPGVDAMAEVLGQAVLDDVRMHGFSNVGRAEFHVPLALPAQAGEANALTVLDESRYARVLVKLFAPPQDLEFASTAVR